MTTLNRSSDKQYDREEGREGGREGEREREGGGKEKRSRKSAQDHRFAQLNGLERVE